MAKRFSGSRWRGVRQKQRYTPNKTAMSNTTFALSTSISTNTGITRKIPTKKRLARYARGKGGMNNHEQKTRVSIRLV